MTPGQLVNFDASGPLPVAGGVAGMARRARTDRAGLADAHYRAGRSAWQLGKSYEAGEHFRAAVEMAPQQVHAWCALSD